MISIYPSEEGFEEIYQLADRIAILTNPQLFHNVLQERKLSPDIEWEAEIQSLKNEMEELIS